ncbi:MAG: radical SAM family heme chaperone HemW [Anaerolineae bacterium]
MITAAPLGLYLHIPWCPTRCIYCDFNTYVEGEASLKTHYHAALRREILQTGAVLERPQLDTIFIGGGTPTTLPPAALLELVETVKTAFALRPGAEVTVEANPGTLSVEYLRELRQGGINRLSLGVQSFNDDELRFLSRLHDTAAARCAVEQARAAGFDNLSLDLIFNLPQQSLAQWQANLEAAIELEPDHLSLYSLIVEPGTPLHRQVAGGQIPWPDDDLAADMYTYALDSLETAGYNHYEISNWAKANGEANWQTPRLASAHNLIYWRNQPYLGLGAGAYGTIKRQPSTAPTSSPPRFLASSPHSWRWMNVKRPQTYIERIEAGAGLGAAHDEKSLETIDPETAMAEHMLLGLRLVREGVSAAEFEARFGVSLTDRYPQAVAHGLERGLTEWAESPTGPRLRLTRQGRFLANQAVVEFMA